MLKVVWLVHMAMRDVCEYYKIPKPTSGGWLETMKTELGEKQDVTLSIICISRSKHKNYRSFTLKNIEYHYIEVAEGNYYGKFSDYLLETLNGIVKKLTPDLIHIHGTEFALPLAIDSEIVKKTPICVSVQGLISIISDRYYFGGISKKQLKFCERLPLLFQHKNALKRGKYEMEIIKRYHTFLGRTDWDRAHIKAINPNSNYIVSAEKVRSEFDKCKPWDLKEITPHSVFCAGGARIPIKGFHSVLQAAKLLLQKYPDLVLYVTGNAPYDGGGIKSRLGYASYLKRLIEKLGMSDHVVFTGNLTAEEMANYFKKSNCYVMASAIENSPNTLLEAMYIGTPCVVSLVGGVSNFVEHQKNALVYRFEEYEMLAQYIEKIFDDNTYACQLSQNARNDIRKKIENIMGLSEVYDQVIAEYRGR